MPPATLPNVFPTPETSDGSLLIKEPVTGNVSIALIGAMSFGNISRESFEIFELVVEVNALESLGSSADEVTDGLINAAIENNEVA